MPGDIWTLLLQTQAPWLVGPLGVLVGVILGLIGAAWAAAAQRKADLVRAAQDRAQTATLSEIERVREVCTSLFRDLQDYSRQALLLRTDANLGRKASFEVTLAITESQASVMETYATARLSSPGPVSDATARIVRAVGDCPILESQEEFDIWSESCRKLSGFLLEVGEQRIKELSGGTVPKNWYESLVRTELGGESAPAATLRGPKRGASTNGRSYARSKSN
ncbi:hypothetical protein [Microlunatus parietis]|uniref:Uncharacterized protein n=1 Tax=Microlunatus parietis TaxID=682979 RepID=A0A7Y9I945_9ACTN|nr:hypothetical protein [Microlunatus parietis]NYE72609.1 hypothetical protein [Microlunatus parietis]